MADSLAIFYCRIYFVPMIFHEIRWNTAIFCWLNPHFSYFPLPGWDNQKVPSSTESQGTTWFFWVFWRQLAPVLGLLLVWACWCITRFQLYIGVLGIEGRLLQIPPDYGQIATTSPHVTTTSMKRWLGLGWLSQWPNFSGELFPNYRLYAHEHVEMMISLKSRIFRPYFKAFPEVTASIGFHRSATCFGPADFLDEPAGGW